MRCTLHLTLQLSPSRPTTPLLLHTQAARASEDQLVQLRGKCHEQLLTWLGLEKFRYDFFCLFVFFSKVLSARLNNPKVPIRK